MKERDVVAVSGLRSALAAIANAEAVPTEDEATAIATAEVTERRAAAREYEAAGHHGRAERLLLEARAIESALGDSALDDTALGDTALGDSALDRATRRDDA
jgi:uncharacterized protein YqeY